MTSGCHRRPRKRRRSRCSHIRPGDGCLRTFLRPPERSNQPSWVRSAMRRLDLIMLVALAIACFAGCASKPDPNTLVMIIESSPTNLDPRVGVDAQSERIDELLFDSLVRRDEHFQLQPWLAESWE